MRLLEQKKGLEGCSLFTEVDGLDCEVYFQVAGSAAYLTFNRSLNLGWHVRLRHCLSVDFLHLLLVGIA